MSPEARAAFSTQMVKAGFEQSAVVKAFEAPTPEIEAQPKTDAAPAYNTGVNLTEDQLNAGLEQWKRLGLDPESFLKAVGADGYQPVEDSRNEQQIEFDKHFPQGKPDEFKISWQGRIPEGFSNPSDLARLDGDVREALSALRFPPALGSSVMEQALDDANTLTRLDDTERQIWNTQQSLQLARQLGEDKAQQAVSNARVLLSVLRDLNPDLHSELLDGGVFSSARTILHLHLQAERLLKRADMA